jgi:hypothetical protein
MRRDDVLGTMESDEITGAPWVQTWTGQAVDLAAPDPGAIRRVDIARSLSRLARFNGHTEEPYTVAQHSVLVARLASAAWIGEAPAAFRLAALLHDAHEAYMGDIVAPVSFLPGFTAPVRQLKQRLQRAIHTRFGLPETLPEDWQRAIHCADLTALATEKRDLMAPPPRPWGALPHPIGTDIRALLRSGSLNCFAEMLTSAADEVARP